MGALPNEKETDNVINLRVVDGKISKKDKVRYNKDGTISKWKSNSVAGVSREVYAFSTKEEIKAMIDVFDKRIEEADTKNHKQIACRDKMMFLIGINVGLRVSDLCSLRWSFFYNEDGTFKEFYTLMPKKTRSKRKFVKIFLNQTVKKAIEWYVSNYPIEDINEYLFKSRKGDGHLKEIAIGRVVKNAAKKAKIEKNVCSHSLRKTWAFWVWHDAEDKSKALVMLQQCLAHSDSMTTMRYIGILDSEKKDMYESIELGLDFI